MVFRTRKVIWSVNALITRKGIFFYRNNRNKSSIYSKKLNILFNETLNRISISPEASITTNNLNIRFVLVRDYYLIFEITELNITVLDIWDTRQNPENFPIKIK